MLSSFRTVPSPMQSAKRRRILASSAVVDGPWAAQAEPEETCFHFFALHVDRGREVGIAFSDRRAPATVYLAQVSDDSRFQQTLRFLSVYPCQHLTISSSAGESNFVALVSEVVEAHGGMVDCSNGKHFDFREGADLIAKAAVVSTQLTLELKTKYVAIAALAALWKFLEAKIGVFMRIHAAQVTYLQARDFLAIDPFTSANLRLTSKSKPDGSPHCLLDLFRTLTPAGRRFLRRSLLEPLATAPPILERQDLAWKFFTNDAFFFGIQKLLPKLGDLDSLLSRMATDPKSRGATFAKTLVKSVMQLRSALALVPELIKLCEAAGLPDLGVDQESWRRCVAAIDAVADTSGPGNFIHAVKNGISPTLEIARLSWLSGFEEAMKFSREVKEIFGGKVKFAHSDSRGYHLTFSGSLNFQGRERLLQCVKVGRKTLATCKELISANLILWQSEKDILSKTLEIFSILWTSTLREEISTLYALASRVAFLDLCWSFADFGATHCGGNACRPEISDTLAVKQAVHPVVKARLSEGQKFVALDYFFQQGTNQFQILTAPNGGGKSTYLSTLGISMVLAQAGCFVPAEVMVFKPVEQLFTRTGSSDSLENGTSAFSTEMLEIAHALHNSDASSLVLMDELCRSTGYEEGLAIAWAVSERLIELGCMCIFATHHHELTKIPEMYSQAKNLHLQFGGNFKALWILGSGKSSEISGYGLAAAEAAELPRRMLEISKSALRVDRRVSPVVKFDGSEYSIHKISEKLKSLSRSTLGDEELKNHLLDLHQKWFE